MFPVTLPKGVADQLRAGGLITLSEGSIEHGRQWQSRTAPITALEEQRKEGAGACLASLFSPFILSGPQPAA